MIKGKKIEIILVGIVIIAVVIFICTPTPGQVPEVGVQDDAAQLDLQEIQQEENYRKSKVYYNVAMQVVNLSDTLRAITYLDSAIGFARRNIPPHQLLQDIYFALGKADSLKSVYDSLAVAFSADPVYVYLAGRMLDVDASQVAFQNTVSLDSTFYWGYIGMGNNFNVKGMFDEAEAAFNKAIELNPAVIDGQLGLGIAYDQLGDYVNAEKQYKIALLINDKIFPEAYMYLGMIYEDRKDTTNALENLTKYLEKVRSGPDVDFIRAKVESIKVAIALKSVEVPPDTSRNPL